MNVRVVGAEWIKEVEIGHEGGRRKNGGYVEMQGRYIKEM